MKKTIRILLVEPGSVPRAIEVPNTLPALQTCVDGYIECVDVMADIQVDQRFILICNEEGKLNELPANRYVPELMDTIVGTFLIAKDNGEGEFISLNDADVAEATAWVNGLIKSLR